jgi:hypothetical protein
MKLQQRKIRQKEETSGCQTDNKLNSGVLFLGSASSDRGGTTVPIAGSQQSSAVDALRGTGSSFFCARILRNAVEVVQDINARASSNAIVSTLAAMSALLPFELPK